MNPPYAEASGFDPRVTAERFVEARLYGGSLSAYPGPMPANFTEAYDCQDAAIGLWPDEIVGWKVGLIPAELHSRYGADRLAGPIFRRNVRTAEPQRPTAFPVFEGGFAAVEAEFVFRLAADSPPRKLVWSPAEAAELVGEVLLGIETAGSPLATINELGPLAVASDFGNNAGVNLGASVGPWTERLEGLVCEVFVDDHLVGSGGAARLPGGPLEALRFLLETCARRGSPLEAGQVVSTGALTGVHHVVSGQNVRAVFRGAGEINCFAVTAHARC